MFNKQCRGFSLIELLVVIGIIAILAAILFPMILTVRSRARDSQCASNLKQIGIAAQMYMIDTGGRYPRQLTKDPVTGITLGGWFYAAKTYAKTKVLTKCPSLISKNGGLISYWSNAYLNSWDTAPATAESLILRRSLTVYLQDGPIADSSTGVAEGQHNWYGPPHAWRSMKDCLNAEQRHSGGANVLFCDWHVRLVKPAEFQTSMTGGAADNPLKNSLYVPTEPWCNRGDGGHPWYRPD